MAKINGLSSKQQVNEAKAEHLAKEIAKVITPVKIKTENAKKTFSATADILNDSLTKKSDATKLMEKKAEVNTTAKGLLTKVKERLSNK